MSTFEFELHEFSNKRETGRKGIVGSFGEVAVSRQKISTRESKRRGSYSEVLLRGEQMPETLYRGIGPGRPSLEEPHLFIDGIPVELDFNRRAFRNKSRALQLTHQGRTWKYTVVHLDQNSILERPGVKISLDRRKSSTGKGTSSYGTATREADAIDLALAILFEGVRTDALTSGGAISSALDRILTPRSNDASSPTGE